MLLFSLKSNEFIIHPLILVDKAQILNEFCVSLQNFSKKSYTSQVDSLLSTLHIPLILENINQLC